MKERKETINIVTANIVSIGILVVSALVLYGIFFLIWDYPDWFYKEKLIEVMDQFGTNYLMFMGALIVGIVVHELIHGLTWAMYAKTGFKSISFGVMWKMLTPYCQCSEPLKVSHYSIGALMPLIVLGILPSIAAICLKSLFWLTMGVIFIAAAAGDIMVVWRLRKENPENMVLDHPSEAGYLVYEEESEDLKR